MGVNAQKNVYWNKRDYLDMARAAFFTADVPKAWAGFRTQLHLSRLNLFGAVVSGCCNWIESLRLKESCRCNKKKYSRIIMSYLK